MSRIAVQCVGLALGLGLGGPVAGHSGAAAVEPPAKPSTVVGRLDAHAGIASTEIGARRVWVLLPPGYDAERRYPVVYAQDGQDLFDAALAAGGEEWALDELLAARPPGIPELLVVGIEAAPEAMRDYSPPGSMDGARGEEYVRFVAEVVKPFVDGKYATRSGPESTFTLGCGAGAVIALYAAWTRPETFGGAMALELPDLDRASLAWLDKRPAVGRPRLWIEQPVGDAARPSATAMLEALRAGAEVHYILGTRVSSRVTLAAAGLRALLTE